MGDEKRSRDDAQSHLNQLLQRVQELLHMSYHMILSSPAIKRVVEEGKDDFFFSHNNMANKYADKILASTASSINTLLLNGIKREWTRGEETLWNRVRLLLSKADRQKKQNDSIREKATQSARDKTAEAFFNEKRGGFSISERVWNLSKNAKKELEIILQNGIKEGKSAAEISKSLSRYLNEPERLFNRVRNKRTGELELSKAAQKYRPGQGVYRSAYKNAMRLARTEMRSAYLESQWNAAQSVPMIVGWRVVLSNNHTTLINGKPVRFRDICDELVGEYPKSFKFRGWHPQCRCNMLPILASQEEQKDLYRKRFDDDEEEWNPIGVKKVPKAFDDWVLANQERAKGWKNLPKFIRDNRKFVQTRFDVDVYSEEERQFTRAMRSKEAMERVLAELSALYPNIPNTELAAIHHYTQNGGNYRQLNKQMEKGVLTDFNRAARTLMMQGLEKLPTYQGTVYRGMIIRKKAFERAFGGDKGDTITHNRFVSTSMDESVGLRFATHSKPKKGEVSVIIAIQSKTGRNISEVSEFNGTFAPENQKEVVFMNNTSFKIIDKRVYPDGDVFLELEEI